MILVTGGAGFIGSHLVRALECVGHKVRVLDNFSRGRRENLDGTQAEVLEGDVRDAGDVRTAMQDVAAVAHLAAIVSVPETTANPILAHDVIAGGTLSVLCAAAQTGARVVVMSSCAVYGEAEDGPLSETKPLRPVSVYGAAKAAAEAYAAAFHVTHGLPVLCLRAFNVYGPGQDPAGPYAGVIAQFVERARAGKPLVVYGDGSQTRDFVYVSDAVCAVVLALDAEAVGAVNVATGKPASVVSLTRAVAELAELVAVEFAPARAGDLRHSWGDPLLAKRVLGFEAQIPLRDGLRSVWDA